jgi:hypothetical protein
VKKGVKIKDCKRINGSIVPVTLQNEAPMTMENMQYQENVSVITL